MSGSFSLSWKRFAVVAAFIIAVPSFFLYVNVRSGGFDATAISLPLLFLSILVFFGFRWFQMRKGFASGKFTEADFRSNPFPIMLGRPLHAALWFCVTLLLVFLPVAWWVYVHWPKA